jgi:hypothetical protein
MGEMAYVFELLDHNPESSATVEVRVAAPTGARYHPLVSTVMEALVKRLGHGRVMFVSPGGELTEADSPRSCPAGRYFAYVPVPLALALARAHRRLIK